MTKKKSKKEEPQLEETKKKYDWLPDVEPTQAYDSAFFEPYVKELEPVLPPDYSDPILDNENKLLMTGNENHPHPTEMQPNVGNLINFYNELTNKWHEDKKMPLIAILMPSFNGWMVQDAGISLCMMFKPVHRFHSVTGHNIGIQRNQLVRMALENDDVTHIFFFDNDTILPPWTLMRMLQRDEDIISGLYHMKAAPFVPLAIKRPKNKISGERKFNYYVTITKELAEAVIPIDACGAGCLLIKREVFENIHPPWFRVVEREYGLSAIGEDLYFFDKAADHGYQPKLDLSIRCDHSTGFTPYPRIFQQQLLEVGYASKLMVQQWNRNAILDTLNLPLATDPRKVEEDRQKELRSETE